MAIHTFVGEAEHDLPFKKGDVLFGERLDGAWWTGRNEKGQKGSFPTNYVREDSGGDAAAPSAPPIASAPGISAAPGVAGDQYGALPAGPPTPSMPGGLEDPAPACCRSGTVTLGQHRDDARGTVMTVRGLQFVTSLFALSFMGAANSSIAYSRRRSRAVSGTRRGRHRLAVVHGDQGRNLCDYARRCARGDRGTSETPPHHLLIDSSIFVLGLLAVTLCPTDLLGLVDGRAVAGPFSRRSISGSCWGACSCRTRTLSRRSSSRRAGRPPGYDLTHGKNGTTPRPGNDSV